MGNDTIAREGEPNEKGQGDWQDTSRGPSWKDVRYLYDELERNFDVELHVRVCAPEGPRRWAHGACRVLAVALRIREGEKDSIMGCSLFGGVSGARTMPAAWVMALYDLEERMTDPSAPWQPAKFPLA